MRTERINRRGYCTAVINVDGTRHDRLVSHLVAEAFIGPRPSGEHLVNHLDDLIHAYATGLRVRVRGRAHGRSKLDEHAVRAIRAARGSMSHRDLAAKHGVSTSAIDAIFTGRTWAWLT